MHELRYCLAVGRPSQTVGLATVNRPAVQWAVISYRRPYPILARLAALNLCAKPGRTSVQ